jgi:hypothetical protein
VSEPLYEREEREAALWQLLARPGLSSEEWWDAWEQLSRRVPVPPDVEERPGRGPGEEG